MGRVWEGWFFGRPNPAVSSSPMDGAARSKEGAQPPQGCALGISQEFISLRPALEYSNFEMLYVIHFLDKYRLPDKNDWQTKVAFIDHQIAAAPNPSTMPKIYATGIRTTQRLNSV